jgi:4-phosphopantoate--beta-alanine ligase
MTSTKVPVDHPRAESLKVREKLVAHFRGGVVSPEGLVAHGRGEAFDYLLGEKTSGPALKAIEAAAAALLTAEKPVISINGNVAALAAEDMVKLSKTTGARIEVNLFYRSLEREQAIRKLLQKAGAREVLGVGEDASARIPELRSERRRVDPRGILSADVVLVPLEDGDRTEALIRIGKRVIAIDLNPLSRTAQRASITIVDNITRAATRLTEAAKRLKQRGMTRSEEILKDFDNEKNLAKSIALVNRRLSKLAREGEHVILGDEILDL